MPEGRAPLLSILMVLLVLVFCVPARAETRTPSAGAQLDDLVAVFERIAARREHSTREGVAKWLRPIRYAILGSPSAAFSRRIDEHFRLVSTLTGLRATRVSPLAMPAVAGSPDEGPRFDQSRSQLILNMVLGGKAHDHDAIVTFGYVPEVYVWRANFIVLVGAEADVKGTLSLGLPGATPEVRDQLRNGTSPCASTVTYVPGRDEIAVAVAILRHDHSDWLVNRCIAEELTQPLGLLNDIKGSALTLFDDDFNQRKSALTPIDELFLKILYSNDILPGMRGEELRYVVQRHLRDHLESADPATSSR